MNPSEQMLLEFFSNPTTLILIIWSMWWKGLALWHASRRGQEWWFIAVLVVNTFGLLELIYLFGVLRLKFAELFSKGR